MMAPVRCFSCGRADIGRYYQNYLGLLRKGYSESDALAELQIQSDCCRVGFLTTNDLSDQISAAGRPVTVDYQMLQEEGKKENPRKIGELGQMIVKDISRYPTKEEFYPAEGVTTEAENPNEAVFTSYEGVEMLSTPIELPPGEPDDLKIMRRERGLFGNKLMEKRALDVPMQQSEMQISMNSTFWGKINWKIGAGPRNDVTHKYYDELLRHNTPLNISFKIIPSLEINKVFAENTKGEPEITPHGLIEEIDEFVNASEPLTDLIEKTKTELLTRGSITSNYSIFLFAVRYLEIKNSPITIASLREALGASMDFSAFVPRGLISNMQTYLLDMKGDFLFSEKESLAQNVMVGKSIVKSEKQKFVINDGTTFMYEFAFYVSSNNDLIKEEYEKSLVDRKFLAVLYPRIELGSNFPIKNVKRDKPFVILFFDDMSLLFLESKLKNAAFDL